MNTAQDQYAEAREVIRRAGEFAERQATGENAWRFVINTEALKRLLVDAYVAGYQECARDAIALVSPMNRVTGVREDPPEYQFLQPECPDHLPPPRGLVPPPTALEVLRAAKPSREVVGLLARESVREFLAGNIDDGLALLALGLCAREVARG